MANKLITAEMVKEQKNGFLHFEDDEVKLIDENNKEIGSQEFATQKEAKEFYDELVFAVASDEEYFQEFVHYLPEFPPQRLQFGKK